MFLVFGLGNPGQEYVRTRHNVGFSVIDRLAETHQIVVNKLKFNSAMGEGFVQGQKMILIKPLTYMNLSGRAVRDFIQFYKPEPLKFVVVYDDTSLPLESIRIRKKGTDGGHNGMKDILYCLETDIFLRVKVGIGPKPPQWDLSRYVISKFSDDELPLIRSGMEKAADAVTMLMDHEPEFVMNRFNTTTKNETADKANEEKG